MASTALVRRAHTIARTSPRSRPVRRRPVRAIRRPARRGRRSGSSSNAWIGYAAAAGIGLALISSTGAGASPAAAAPAPTVGGPGVAAAYTGVATGCVLRDPTTSGCVTGATDHALAEIDRQFGGYRKGPKIRSAGCWDAHAWNPTSDHPKGKGCDLFFAPTGTFAAGDDLAHGWELANWLRANAAGLRVSYVIWQGRIWTAGCGDSGGWGSKYSGGGVYNPADATGGHFDHVHVSFQI
jgi:hypothetical protein